MLVGLLAALAVQTGPAPQPDLASWYLLHADRSGMVAVSSDVVKEGISGAYTTMLFVNPEPQPGKPNVSDMKVEFDCISKQLRFDGGVTSNFGSPPRMDDTGTNWEEPTKGTNLAQTIEFACQGNVPPPWINTHLNADDLIRFYFEKFLGQPMPK